MRTSSDSYEIGFSGEFKDEDGENVILDFDRVADLLDEKIAYICEEVGATEEPVLYLTGDEKLAKQQKVEYKPNFRDEVAVTKVYKGTRKSKKPYHWRNITAYMLANYECHVSYGLEADDSMCIEQCYWLDRTLNGKEPHDTIICSRDKDLRMCPGWHYSWECGKQSSHGPVFVDHNDPGYLEEKPDGKVIGYGDMFFYYQMLIGDPVDNIPGVPKVGTKKAYPLLKDMKSSREMYEAVRELYQEKLGDDWKPYMREQANLLWMVREQYDGEPVMFSPPKEV
jgi:hypothetical protein